MSRAAHPRLSPPRPQNTCPRLERPPPNLPRSPAVQRRLLAGGDTLFTGEDETFAFRRAISRLVEMGSAEYLHGVHEARRAAAASAAAPQPTANVS